VTNKWVNSQQIPCFSLSILTLIFQMNQVIEAKDGGSGVTTGAISRAKLQSNHHHQQTKPSFFTGWMPFLSPNHQCQSTEEKNITSHGLAYFKPTWGVFQLCLRPQIPCLLLINLEYGNVYEHYCRAFTDSLT